MITNINDSIKEDIHIEKNNKCIIVSAFSCLGKTYLGQKYKNVLDLEASLYKWIYFDDNLAKEIEKRKGIKDRIVNPSWPQNYLEALNQNLLKYNVILITPEKEIRKILSNAGMTYFLAYPTNPDFVKNRAIKRGNNYNFAEGLKKSFLQWYPEENEHVLWVNENEYLEDVLKREKTIFKKICN